MNRTEQKVDIDIDMIQRSPPPCHPWRLCMRVHLDVQIYTKPQPPSPCSIAPRSQSIRRRCLFSMMYATFRRVAGRAMAAGTPTVPAGAGVRHITCATLPALRDVPSSFKPHVHSPTCGCTPMHDSSTRTSVPARAVSTTAAPMATSNHNFIGKELVEPTSGPLAPLFENNRKWATGKRADDEKYFETLAKGQQPKYLFIGCADSRVPANQILGLGPGEVFVHRNIANMVVGGDLSVRCCALCVCCALALRHACCLPFPQVQSVVEYAVEHLKVEDIIVCGHYGCGGVQGTVVDGCGDVCAASHAPYAGKTRSCHHAAGYRCAKLLACEHPRGASPAPG